MRIGFIATRLSGTDGVSLEVAKWVRVLERLGHESFFCAGELGGYAAGGTWIPQMHFMEKSIQRINQRAFGSNTDHVVHTLLEQVDLLAIQLHAPVLEFIRANNLDMIIIQNALAIPMNLPLGVCLTKIISETGIRTIAHHHDFFWERERYQSNYILDLLDTHFPPDLPTIQHVTINTIAREKLRQRRGINSTVIPNVYDYASPPPAPDIYSCKFRQALDLPPGTPFILQPTRVIQRKGIELALELVGRLGLHQPALVITHSAADEGLAYWRWLEREARLLGVSLKLVDSLIAEKRNDPIGSPIYSLADAYLSADLVTYPSLYEGFGNALLEAIYYKRPVVVNRYPVYNKDIRPLGFQFIELDGFVDDRAVEQATQILSSPGCAYEMLEGNFRIAREHFSLEALQGKLEQLLG